jgi:cytochrome c556
MVFVTSVDDLRAASARRDIDGVGAAYATVITSCVHCHATVRDARSVSLRLRSPHTD